MVPRAHRNVQRRRDQELLEQLERRSRFLRPYALVPAAAHRLRTDASREQPEEELSDGVQDRSIGRHPTDSRHSGAAKSGAT